MIQQTHHRDKDGAEEEDPRLILDAAGLCLAHAAVQPGQHKPDHNRLYDRQDLHRDHK
jgi:hypothetical protein